MCSQTDLPCSPSNSETSHLNLLSAGLPVFHRIVLPINSKPVLSRRQIEIEASSVNGSCESFLTWFCRHELKTFCGSRFPSDDWMIGCSPVPLGSRFRDDIARHPLNSLIFACNLWTRIDNALCCSKICVHYGIPKFFDKHIYLWLFSKGSRQMINLFFVRWTDLHTARYIDKFSRSSGMHSL